MYHGMRKHHHKGCCHTDNRCACHQGSYVERHYLTKEEKVTRLENYLEDLQQEVKAVQEHLEEMKAA
jgi:hypothetical protein